MVRFIHTADLHLGSAFVGLTKKQESLAHRALQASFEAFLRVVDIAIAEAVDFVCIVGDVYDSSRQHIQEQLFLKQQCERLDKAHIPVFLVHGNHDFVDRTEISLPKNVFRFSEEVDTATIVTKDGSRVAISGFSYRTRWIAESRVPAFPQRSQTVDFHIGLYHGEMAQEGNQQHSYAPFRMTQMEEKQYDYWALGHIHTPMILHHHPVIAYSGNIQGRSFKEQGRRGAYLVELEKGKEAVLTEVHTAVIEWKEWTLAWDKEESFESFVHRFQQLLQQERWENHAYFTRLLLTSSHPLTDAMRETVQEECQRVLQTIHEDSWLLAVKGNANPIANSIFSALTLDVQEQSRESRMQAVMQKAEEHRTVYQLLHEEVHSSEWMQEVQEEAAQLIQQFWKEDSYEDSQD